MRTQTKEEFELACLVVSSLNLELAAGDIDPEAPLYREGLGLDSIDMLEMALAISKAYGFQLKPDEQEGARIFGSLQALSAHIEQHRART